MRLFFRMLAAFGIFACSSTVVFAQNDANSIKSQPAKPPELIPPETFAAPGQMIRPILSPDGLKMVYREHIGTHKTLTIKALETGQIERIKVPENNTLKWYRWAGNSKILMSVRGVLKRGSREYWRSSLFAYDIKKESFQSVGRWQTVADGDNALYVDPDGEYLLQSIQASSTEYPTVYRVGLTDNDVSIVVYPQKKIWRWLADDAGVV
ncbi:MAG: hypothetical protein ABJJ20_12595, partial [Lentilitoribacter sp.]